MTRNRQHTPKLKAHTPGELAQNYVRWAQSIHDSPGITWGIPPIDKRMIPMRPGDFIALVARPGHCKSTMLAYLAKREAEQIIARGTQETEAVVFCTWEGSAEEIENFWISDGEFSSSDVAWGRVPMDIIKSKMSKRANFPVWTVGYSIANAGKLQPRMFLPNVLDAIEGMERDFGVKPTLLLFDYLQLIPVDGAKDKHSQVMQAPFEIKDLALRVGAPAVAAVQAKVDVDRRDDKIPDEDDCQWSSAINQTADKQFGFWRPCKTEDPNGEPIEHNGRLYPITESLFFMRMTKQRWEQARHTWALHLAPQWLRLAAMETENGTQADDF